MSALLNKNWKDLIKPSKLDVKPVTGDARKAVVVAEPLERGFGITLGVAVRRILLSSLQGAAVTSIKIDGVLHEFSAIDGVVEDVPQAPRAYWVHRALRALNAGGRGAIQSNALRMRVGSCMA